MLICMYFYLHASVVMCYSDCYSSVIHNNVQARKHAHLLTHVALLDTFFSPSDVSYILNSCWTLVPSASSVVITATIDHSIMKNKNNTTTDHVYKSSCHQTDKCLHPC